MKNAENLGGHQTLGHYRANSTSLPPRKSEADGKLRSRGLYSVTPVLDAMGGRRVSEKQIAHCLNPCR